MKKKNLNLLKLNKRSISNLGNSKTQGTKNIVGASITPIICATTVIEPGIIIASNLLNCDTIDQTRGCPTDSCDQTFTCPDWSCECN